MSNFSSESALQSTVACPKCGTPVPLTEALAAPLIEATRAEYEAKLRAQNETVARQQEELSRKQQETQVAEQQLTKREVDIKRRYEEARAEIGTQREQLAAEVARQTEAAVTKELAERLIVERKAIAEAESSRAAQRFAGELAERGPGSQRAG